MSQIQTVREGIANRPAACVAVSVLQITQYRETCDVSRFSRVVTHPSCRCDQEGHVLKGLSSLPGFGWFTLLQVYGCANPSGPEESICCGCLDLAWRNGAEHVRNTLPKFISLN